MKPIDRYLRKINNKQLNVLTGIAHERHDHNLFTTFPEITFYSINEEHVRGWDERKAPIPPNLKFINRSHLQFLEFDFMICGNPLAHYNWMQPISQHFNIPLILIFHTEPPQGFNKDTWKNYPFKNHKCVFITPHNEITWTGESKNRVIHHMIDSSVFYPREKENYILCMVNDWLVRSNEHGLNITQHITKDLPLKIIGDSPGLSKPANSLEELSEEIGKASIFLHTPISSPLSMSLLEAAASSCAIVCTSVCSVPDYFEHGEDAMLFSPNRPEDGREYLINLLNNERLRIQLGESALHAVADTKTIHSRSKYRKMWEDVFGSF